ncbi:MAG: hypothetical protein ACYDH0_07275 [Candidatus Aminicenantales bacterium]
MRRMKRMSIAVALAIGLVVALANPVLAQRSGTGLGFILGDPTGLSFKTWTGRTTALDAAAAWAFTRKGSFHFHADYLIHSFNLLKTRKGSLPVYYGIGGRVLFEDETKVGVRIPVGISYIFEDAPLDLFFELGPVLDLAPRTEMTLAGFIGLRYYFR